MTVRFFYPSTIKALASCTTIRICLCKSFKELFLQRNRQFQGESGCKGKDFCNTMQIFFKLFL